jgi:hypothetical protein
MVARARAHRFLAIESTSTSTPVLVESGSGPASIVDQFSSASIWGGFSSPTAPPSSSPTSSTASSGPDLGRRLRFGEGSRVPPRRPRAHQPHQSSRRVRIWGGRERELRQGRKRELRKSREKESRVERVECVFWKMVYGKIFRKPFSYFSLTIFRSTTNIFC